MRTFHVVGPSKVDIRFWPLKKVTEKKKRNSSAGAVRGQNICLPTTLINMVNFIFSFRCRRNMQESATCQIYTPKKSGAPYRQSKYYRLLTVADVSSLAWLVVKPTSRGLSYATELSLLEIQVVS